MFGVGKVLQVLCKFVNRYWTIAEDQATLFEVYRHYCGADVVKAEVKCCTEQPMNCVRVELSKLERRPRMCVSEY